MTKENIKIAFIRTMDSKDYKSSWIGTYSFMINSLAKHCGEVIIFERPKSFLMFLGKLYNKLLNVFFDKNFDFFHSIVISKNLGKKLQRKLINREIDVIFAPAASTLIAFLDISIPIIYMSDATFKLMNNYYKSSSNLVKTSIKSGDIIESNSIKKSAVSVFSSQWAANSAINDYKTKHDKVKVILYGANIKNVPSEDDLINKKNDEKCRLLFLGVDWERKGGPIVYEAMEELKRLGMKIELVVCGCIPPKEFLNNDITVYPFLNKQNEEEQKKFDELLLTSNFLFIPTRAECTPIVFCEASAFGLPIISTDTGGVSSMVKNGKNGFLLNYDANGKEYANLISEIFNDKKKYNELILSTRNIFDEYLNWDSWGNSFAKIINNIIQNKTTSNITYQ